MKHVRRSTQRTSYTLDVNDRLTQETTQESINGGAFSPKSSTSYQFDANGNLTRVDKTEAGATPATATTLYTWSPQHWLTSITTNAGTAQGKTVQYALSTEGLRLSARTAPEAVANKIALQGENPLTQAEREQMEVEHYAWDTTGEYAQLLATYQRIGYGEYLPTSLNIQAHVGTDTMAAAHTSHRAGIPSGAGGYGVQLGTIHFTPHQPGQSTFRSAANPADIQTIRSLHGDALGHLKLTANQNGQIEQQQSYDAFGIALTPLQSNVAGSQGSGINQTPMSQTSKLGAFGELTDNGQVYLRARVLDPSTGRFVSTDPFAGYELEPRSLHKFAYAHNAPTVELDPSGLMSMGEIGAGLNVQTVLSTQSTLTYQFVYRKAGCYVVEAVAEQAITKGIYIFMDGLGGPSYVGKTDRSFDKRLAEHAKSGSREVTQVFAKFGIKGGPAANASRVIEQHIIDVFRGANKPLSNINDAINKQRGRLLPKLKALKLCP